MEKFLKELEENKNPAIRAIGEHLKQLAEQDDQIKMNLGKEKKSLKNCFKYITNEARKYAINNCAMIEDKQVYGWAVHYYDEDDLEIDKEKPRMNVSKNQHPRGEKKTEQQKAAVKEVVKKVKKAVNENQGSLF